MKRTGLRYLQNGKLVSNAQWTLVAVVLLVSLFTLGVSPLPWYDEVDFSSITMGYAATGKYFCTANDLYFTAGNMEVLYYGPVYFVLNSIIIKLFGIGIVQFRILNFISGIVCITLFVKLFKRLLGEKYTQLPVAVFVLLMLSDYTYLQDMHSGRMDLLALAFILLGLLAANPQAKNIIPLFFLSGIFIGVGLLTTPRVYFLVIPYFSYLLYLYIKTKQGRLLTGIIVSVCTCCLLYYMWIWFKFGSVDQFATYLNSETSYFDTASNAFFLNNFDMPAHQAVYYILLLGLLVATFIRKKQAVFNPVNLICIGTLAFFLCFAGGSIIYMSMVTGFVYILAINLAGAWEAKSVWILMILMLANLGLFGYKYMVVLGNLAGRDSNAFGQWVQQQIPAGSKVVAEDKYYYSLLKSGSQFQYLYRGGTDDQRVEYHSNKWEATHLFINDTSSQIFQKYRRTAKLIFAGEYGHEWEAYDQPGYAGSYHGYLFRFVR